MNWARPDMLLLLWLLPVLAVLLGVALRRRRHAMARLGTLVSVRTSARTGRIHVVRGVLWLLAFGSIVTALAQPRWGFRWQELRQEGLSLVVVLDVSRSMSAEDVSPSRMERARREVRDLAGMLAGDRVGLVLSAGGAYAQMPLTLDYAVLDVLARRASPDVLRAQGTDLGLAIDKAMELLSDTEQTGDRAIVILSDGEDHASTAVEAAQRAADAGVHLYTIGIGTPGGAPMPLPGGGFKKDQSGEIIISRLNEASLQEIASVGQGAYVRSVAGVSDMEAIYFGQIRQTLSAAEQGVRREKIWTERHPIFLLAGLLLVVLSYALRPGALRLGATAALALTVSTAHGQSLDDLLQQQASNPNDPLLTEQVAAALYEAGRYSEAARLLEQLADNGQGDQHQRARYNAGLARYHAGQLTDALDNWQQVLSTDPGHEHAQHNAEAVQAEIQARLQPPQEQPSPQDENEQSPQEPQDADDSSQSSPSDAQQQGGQDTASPSPSASDTGGAEDPSEPQNADEADASNDGTMQPQTGAGDTGMNPEEAISNAEAMSGDAEADPDASTVAGEGTQGDEEMSEDAARRLLESVEEGDPRVQVGDSVRGGKDW